MYVLLEVQIILGIALVLALPVVAASAAEPELGELWLEVFDVWVRGLRLFCACGDGCSSRTQGLASTQVLMLAGPWLRLTRHGPR